MPHTPTVLHREHSFQRNNGIFQTSPPRPSMATDSLGSDPQVFCAVQFGL